jgi:hypothetical protein
MPKRLRASAGVNVSPLSTRALKALPVFVSKLIICVPLKIYSIFQLLG